MEIRVRKCEGSKEEFGRYDDPFEQAIIEVESERYGTFCLTLGWDEHGESGLSLDRFEKGGDGVQRMFYRAQWELEQDL